MKPHPKIRKAIADALYYNYNISESEPSMQLICPKCLETSWSEFRLDKFFKCTSCNHSFDFTEDKPCLLWRQSKYSLITTNKELLEKARHDNKASLSRFKKLAKALTKPVNKISEKNIRQLISLTKRGSSILVIGGSSIGEGIHFLYSESNRSDYQIASIDIIPTNHVNWIADAHNLPFQASTFDVIIIQAVLEHVIVPERVVQEAFRVLKSKGLIYVETPFLQPVHEGAFDFQRFSRSGHRYLLRQFSEVSSGKLGGPIESIIFIISVLTNKVTGTKLGSLTMRIMSPLVKFIDTNLFSGSKFNDCSVGFFFMGIKDKSSFKTNQIVEYYQ